MYVHVNKYAHGKQETKTDKKVFEIRDTITKQNIIMNTSDKTYAHSI